MCGALWEIWACLKLTMFACCQRKAPGRVCHWSPPASAPPDGGHLWVGQGWAPHCAAGPPLASLGRWSKSHISSENFNQHHLWQLILNSHNRTIMQLPKQDMRDIPDTWPTPSLEAPALSHPQKFDYCCLQNNSIQSNHFMSTKKTNWTIMHFSLGRKEEKGTSVIWISIDYLQEGNFGKSRFTKAPFGWWLAVRQWFCIVSIMSIIIKTRQTQIHQVLHFFVEDWARAIIRVRPTVFVLEAIGQPWKEKKKYQNSCWSYKSRKKTNQTREKLSNSYLCSVVGHNENRPENWSKQKLFSMCDEEALFLPRNVGLLKVSFKICN